MRHSVGEHSCLLRNSSITLTTTSSSDPWWIFTTINLFWNIKQSYSLGFIQLIKISPRFGILLLSMCLSVSFIVVDILSVTSVLQTGAINPSWKFSPVFKCFTDTIILNDFKTALDKIVQHKAIRLPRATFIPRKPEPSFEQQENVAHIELCSLHSVHLLERGRVSIF